MGMDHVNAWFTDLRRLVALIIVMCVAIPVAEFLEGFFTELFRNDADPPDQA